MIVGDDGGCISGSYKMGGVAQRSPDVWHTYTYSSCRMVIGNLIVGEKQYRR